MGDYKVYKHTAPNGKVYIGITRQPIAKRWKNGEGYDGCTAFYRAIKKYGWDNIKHEILDEGLSKEAACEKEIAYIAEYQSTNPAYGYNLTHGGEHYEFPDYLKAELRAQIVKRFVDNPEIGRKISESQRGRKAAADTKRKMSEARKAYIAKHPEARKQCGDSFRGKSRGAEFRDKLRKANYKKVICLETGAVFNSVQEAAETFGVCRTSVSNVLTGRSQTAANMHFAYLNGGNNANE